MVPNFKQVFTVCKLFNDVFEESISLLHTWVVGIGTLNEGIAPFVYLFNLSISLRDKWDIKAIFPELVIAGHQFIISISM